MIIKLILLALKEELEDLMDLLPKPKRYRICEDPDELGYWLEEVQDDECIK
jgi:hypothetical protein